MDRLTLNGTPFPFGLTFVPDGVLESAGLCVAGATDLLAGVSTELGASFAFVPAAAPHAERTMAALIEADVAPFWTVSGPLWPVIEAQGVMEGLRATLTHPGEVGSEIDVRLDALLSEVERGAELGARAIVLAEDLAGTDGPLIAPDFAIAELLPRYRKVVSAAGSLGLPAVLHSDGDIRPLLGAVTRAGFVAVHAGGGLGFEAFDRLFWAARDAGLAVIGGLLTGELRNAARAEAIGSTIGVLAQAGGLLVADDGGITTARELAGLVTALHAARNA